jgi:hypothetical protein
LFFPLAVDFVKNAGSVTTGAKLIKNNRFGIIEAAG